MYDVGKHTEVEGFILKWTFISVFVGVVLLFILKILALLGLYVSSGRLMSDFGSYIGKALKSMFFGG